MRQLTAAIEQVTAERDVLIEEYRNYGRTIEPVYAAPPAPIPPNSPAVRDVLAEQYRVRSQKGYTPEHDDHHTKGELAIAAACYAIHSVPAESFDDKDRRLDLLRLKAGLRSQWPLNYIYPTKERRANLVAAAQLAIAEIERLERAAAKGGAA